MRPSKNKRINARGVEREAEERTIKRGSARVEEVQKAKILRELIDDNNIMYPGQLFFRRPFHDDRKQECALKQY